MYLCAEQKKRGRPKKKHWIDDKMDYVLSLVMEKGVVSASQELGVTRDVLYSRLRSVHSTFNFNEAIKKEKGRIKIPYLRKTLCMRNSLYFIREKIKSTFDFYDSATDTIPLEKLDDVLKEMWFYCKEEDIKDEFLRNKVIEHSLAWVRVKDCMESLKGIVPLWLMWSIVRKNDIPVKKARGCWWFYLPPDGDPLLILRYADFPFGDKLKPYAHLVKIYAQKREAGEIPRYKGKLSDVKNLNEYW